MDKFIVSGKDIWQNMKELANNWKNNNYEGAGDNLGKIIGDIGFEDPKLIVRLGWPWKTKNL